MPINPTDYSYKVVKPFAYESTTSPVGQKAHSFSTRQVGKSALEGAATGSAFGPYGALVGAAVGLGTDLWQASYAKKRAKEANEEARRAAAEASARSSAEARAARAYNSEGAQIRRMRMAGLSPGLAYGQMSPSTAVAAPQEKADVSKADTPKFDNESILHALQLLINQQNANTQLAAQQSTANLQDTQSALNRIEAQYKAQEKLASISAILAQKDLTDEQKLSIIAKRMPEIELLESQVNLADANARGANANANVTEQTGVPLANSQIGSNVANARNLNANAAVTEDYGKKLAEAELALKQESKHLTKTQRDKIQLDYYLTNDQYDVIGDWLAKNGYDERYAPLLMIALQNLANSSGMEVTSLVDDLVHLPSNMIKHSMEAAKSLMR